MGTKVNSDIILNSRRSFLLNTIAIIASVFSMGRFIQRQLSNSTTDKSTYGDDQLTTNIIQPSIHPLAVPRSKKSSK
jgi:hypothetical protein